MILSILIATKYQDRKRLDHLLSTLLPQIKGLDGQLHVDIEAGGSNFHVGDKMNSLLRGAEGKYCWMLQDTDLVSDTAIQDLLSSFLLEPDILTISGMTTFNHRNPCDWTQGIHCERKPNHNSPMRTELARLIPFRKRKVDALEIWAREMNRLNPWKTETEIEHPIIHNRHELTGYTQTRN
jgi:hypothetical protein